MSEQTLNRLERREMRVLEDLVVKHSTEITSGKWTTRSFAQFATGRMDRPITSSNVQTACNTVDISFPMGRSGEALRSIGQLRKAICVLSTEITRVCGELGVTCSPEVLDIAKLCSNKDENS